MGAVERAIGVVFVTTCVWSVRALGAVGWTVAIGRSSDRRGESGLGGVRLGAGAAGHEVDEDLEDGEELGGVFGLGFDLVVEFAEHFPGFGVEDEVALLESVEDDFEVDDDLIDAVGAFASGGEGSGGDACGEGEFVTGFDDGVGGLAADEANAAGGFGDAFDLLGGEVAGFGRGREGVVEGDGDGAVFDLSHGDEGVLSLPKVW